MMTQYVMTQWAKREHRLQIAQCRNQVPENKSKGSEWNEPRQEEAEFRRRY